MRCERCDAGEVVDGYCDNCGKRPVATRDGTAAIGSDDRSPRRRPAPAPTTRPSTTTGTRGRPGHDGLVEIPHVPSRDPLDAVLVDPNVAEHHRYCTTCDEPVGRSRDGERGRTQGFCPKCGTPFSFSPKLRPGDLVKDQYEVIGCLAHGGLGWVYLARDHQVGFWVVLKGLIDAGDTHAQDAAIAEKQYLAAVAHPNIVKIHNFVEHEGDGYIVMEYVDGKSLRAELEERRTANGGVADPLSVEEAIAYCLTMLPALGHLHDLGIVYCDFKPDNVIHTKNTVKLIDLGGAWRLGDQTGQLWGTPGFQAPEVAATWPTVASDLYTVARTLAVLCTDFAGYQGTYATTLPAPSEVPLYAEFPSLYAFLERATAFDPTIRFQSADEMAAQLDGVLREIVAARRGVPAPTTSTRFTSHGRGSNVTPDWRTLPTPLVNADDPGAALILSLTNADDHEVIEQLGNLPATTVDTELWHARSLIATGQFDDAALRLGDIAARHSDEWRVDWYRGVCALANGDAAAATTDFDRVYRHLPGELAPKLALGIAAEIDGDSARAVEWYDTASRTDPSFTSATFGVARCCEALGDHAAAIAAYRTVPHDSSAHVEAGLGEVRLLMQPPADPADRIANLLRAAAALTRLPLDKELLRRTQAQILEAILEEIERGGAVPDSASIFGYDLTERGVRLGLEKTYRSVARLAGSTAEKVALVDRANRVRPRTFV